MTLGLDPESQASLDALRARHFPAGRNHLAAHVTLFHALPGEEVDAVLADAREVAHRTAHAVEVAALRPLGRGVALVLRSAELDATRAELARRWAGWLTPQDRQRFAAHVTVQNKVTPERARATLAGLAASFAPWEATATGLRVWRYLGGPWEHVADAPFTG